MCIVGENVDAPDMKTSPTYQAGTMLPIPDDNSYVQVYRTKAERYDALVSAEDADRHIGPALKQALGSLSGQRIAEVGAGTGRLTTLLVAASAHVDATDAAEAMLVVAERNLQALGLAYSSWTLQTADARELPLESGAYDSAVAGWVLGHFNAWFGDAWRDEISTALGEMDRVLRPGGVAVIFETLGTATDGPGAPSPGLARYYEFLESQGFERTVL